MLRVLAVIVLVPLLTLLAWLGLAGSEPRADLVVASDELRTIDPHRVSFMDEIQVAGALFEGLTRINAETLLPEPAAAEAMPEVSSDGLTYTFHLRENARWSNGETLTADHFRWSWLRVLDPALAAQYVSLLFVIDGARAYFDSRLDGTASNDVSDDAVGVEAVDSRTFRVRLAAPCAYFLELTSFPTLSPVYPPIVAGGNSDGGGVFARHWTKPDRIVSNGPFVLASRDFKKRLLLVRNPHHWESGSQLMQTEPPGSRRVESIEVFITSSAAAALIAYETGRIDLVRGVEPEVARALNRSAAAGARPDFHVSPLLATFFFRVNCARPPFDNPELRKALSLAIDREAICEHVLGLGETPADTFVPRSAIAEMPRAAANGDTIWYSPPDGLGTVQLLGNRIPLPYAERKRQAREHLDRSGFAALGRTIELSYASDPPQQRKLVESVQSMWESALGIRVELRVMERKVLSERIRALDYDIVRSDWYGDYLDPATFLELFVGESGQNRTGWKHPGYDDLIARAAASADHAERYRLLSDAERILCEAELPILPVYYKTGNFLLNPLFSGLQPNARDLLAIDRVRRVR